MKLKQYSYWVRLNVWAGLSYCLPVTTFAVRSVQLKTMDHWVAFNRPDVSDTCQSFDAGLQQIHTGLFILYNTAAAVQGRFQDPIPVLSWSRN